MELVAEPTAINHTTQPLRSRASLMQRLTLRERVTCVYIDTRRIPRVIVHVSLVSLTLHTACHCYGVPWTVWHGRDGAADRGPESG